MEIQELMRTMKESIKLTRNSRGFTWEIRLHDDTADNLIPRLEKLNKQMEAKFGNGESEDSNDSDD